MSIPYLLIAIILFTIGLTGVIIPIIPDLVIIWLGIFIYALGTKFTEISITEIVFLGFLSLTTYLVDYLATTLGAKRHGASKWGIVGGIVGGILGLIIQPPFGFLLGFILGIILTEVILLKRTTDTAVKAAKGALLGFILGFLVKLAIAGTMIGFFFFNILQ